MDVPTAVSYRLQPRSKLSAECPQFPAKLALAIAKSRPSLLFRSIYVGAGFMGIRHVLLEKSGRPDMQHTVRMLQFPWRKKKRNEIGAHCFHDHNFLGEKHSGGKAWPGPSNGRQMAT